MTDLSKSLEALEHDVWDEPEFGSHVVLTCHRARKKPLCQLTDEELRCMIGQKIGLPYLLPLAVERLRDDPLIAVTFYEGDLLHTLLRLEPGNWAADTLERFSALLSENRQLLEACENIPAALLNKYI